MPDHRPHHPPSPPPDGAARAAPADAFHDDPQVLVSTGWLARHLDGVRLLDASWYLPAMARDARAEFERTRLPGARFFDIDAVATPDRGLPHMAPAPGQLAQALAGLGIGPQAQVVVYDGAGLFSAARVWWTLRLMGWSRVAVLDGGLPKWRAEGRRLENGPPGASPAAPAGGRAEPPVLRLVPALVRTADQVAEAARTGSAQLLDARPAARFRGEVPEPRPGLRPGHIPGARSLPFSGLLAPDGTLLPPEALRAAFAAAGIDLARPVITSCGSGISAAVLNLALARLGHGEAALYDGSWAEWGQPASEGAPARPVATGDDRRDGPGGL